MSCAAIIQFAYQDGINSYKRTTRHRNLSPLRSTFARECTRHRMRRLALPCNLGKWKAFLIRHMFFDCDGNVPQGEWRASFKTGLHFPFGKTSCAPLMLFLWHSKPLLAKTLLVPTPPQDSPTFDYFEKFNCNLSICIALCRDWPHSRWRGSFRAEAMRSLLLVINKAHNKPLCSSGRELRK